MSLTPLLRCAALAASLGLVGCAGSLKLPGAPSAASLSLAGNYEAIAGCVAQVATQRSGGGSPELKIDRAGRQATVRRTLQPGNELRYEIRFTQTGAADVQVEGRAAPGSAPGAADFAFLWPQVSQCATHLTAP